jgi:hypothetical protein
MRVIVSPPKKVLEAYSFRPVPSHFGQLRLFTPVRFEPQFFFPTLHL